MSKLEDPNRILSDMEKIHPKSLKQEPLPPHVLDIVRRLAAYRRRAAVRGLYDQLRAIDPKARNVALSDPEAEIYLVIRAEAILSRSCDIVERRSPESYQLTVTLPDGSVLEDFDMLTPQTNENDPEVPYRTYRQAREMLAKMEKYCDALRNSRRDKTERSA